MGPKTCVLTAVVLVLAGCASTGVISAGDGTYMLAKRVPQFGMGTPTKAIAEVLAEASAYCERQGRVMRKVDMQTDNSAYGQPGGATLTFACDAK